MTKESRDVFVLLDGVKGVARVETTETSAQLYEREYGWKVVPATLSWKKPEREPKFQKGDRIVYDGRKPVTVKAADPTWYLLERKDGTPYADRVDFVDENAVLVAAPSFEVGEMVLDKVTDTYAKVIGDAALRDQTGICFKGYGGRGSVVYRYAHELEKVSEK